MNKLENKILRECEKKISNGIEEFQAGKVYSNIK